MEKITVYKETRTINKVELEIEDIRNCFLKGRDNLLNTVRYLGIWTDNDGTKIVEIIEDGVYLNFSKNNSDSTRTNIEIFIRERNNVEIISEKEFRNILDKFTNLLKINN